LKAENQLKFQQHSTLAQRVRTTIKLLRREMPDFIIEPNPRLFDITGVGMSTSQIYK